MCFISTSVSCLKNSTREKENWSNEGFEFHLPPLLNLQFYPENVQLFGLAVRVTKAYSFPKLGETFTILTNSVKPSQLWRFLWKWILKRRYHNNYDVFARVFVKTKRQVNFVQKKVLVKMEEVFSLSEEALKEASVERQAPKRWI